MLEQMNGWAVFALIVVLVFAALAWLMKQDEKDLKAYHDSVKAAIDPGMYNEAIVDWHFYENHDAREAANECREYWGLGRL